MVTSHSLIFFFFLATLREGNACLGDGRFIPVLTETVGGSLTFVCHFTFPEKMKMLCKGDCKDGDILVATTGLEAQRGRYSLEYKDYSRVSMSPTYVRITNLTKSDSGMYSCTSEGALAETQIFELKVVDAQTAPQPKFTLRPFLTSTPRAPAPETTLSSTSEPKQLPNITGLLNLLLTPTPPASILETPSAEEFNRVPEGDREHNYQDRSPPEETPEN